MNRTGKSISLTVVLILLAITCGCAHGDKQSGGELSKHICSKPFPFPVQKSERQYDLVFEGGGAKGTVFVGALQELEAQKISGRRFVGTSAGAITATLLAAGYTADDMLAAVNEKINDKPRFSTFMDLPEKFEQQDIMKSYTYDFFSRVEMPFIPKRMEDKIDEKIFERLMEHDRYRTLFSFIERGGVYEGRKFQEWIKEKLNADCRNLGEATFSEFYEITHNELTVIASDTSDHRMLVLNRHTAPDCQIAWAVRMSMSIPFVWQEVRWDNAWGGKYRGRDIANHTVVDGGVLSNFPLKLVVDTDKETADAMGGGSVVDDLQIGFLIDETKAVPGAKSPETNKGLLDDAKELKTVQRILRLVDTMSDARDNDTISTYAAKVCFLPAKGYGTTEFDMSDERVKHLVNAGRKAAKEFLEKQVIRSAP